MKILNLTRNTTISQNTKVASSFLARMVGLLNRDSLSEGEGLVITHCQQIHMFCMRFPIDVIFVDKNNVIVGLVKNIRPSAVSPIFWKADRAIELPVATIEKSYSQLNDVIGCILE